MYEAAACACYVGSGWQTGAGTWLVDSCLDLTLWTPDWCTSLLLQTLLSDLPTHDKATWGTTEVRALRLEWVARSAAALPESSSGGDQSLSPPNITAPRAGFCVSLGNMRSVCTVPPSHLYLLRSIETSGSLSCPVLSIFPSQGRQPQ